MPVSGGQWLFGPDGLAGGGLATAPALGDLGNQQQPASALVEDPGPAQVGAVPLPSETSQMSVEPRMRRSRIGASP